jgi:hypothetical protein
VPRVTTGPFTFGALGDIHGDFATVRAIMARHPDVPFWVSPGDVGGDEGCYENPPSPLFWIKGNNEVFDYIARLEAGAERVPNLCYVPNAVPVTADSIRIAGLGGTFAPTWYDTPRAALPFPAPAALSGASRQRSARLADKRRHFVREEVERCKMLREIDLFLSHEAPRPFHVSGRGGRVTDAGKTPLNEILEAVKPRLHLFGHHHRFDHAVRQGVPSVCLDPVAVSYLLIDGRTLAFERREV